jgi:hypothetical protein
MGSKIFFKENSKFVYVLLVLNLIFPIISVEDLIPWVICIFSMYKTIKSINENYKQMSRAVMFLILNGVVVVVYNLLVYIILNYLTII